MASGIPGPRGKLANLFSQKRGTSFPSVDSSGLSSSLVKGQICDSDIVSVPVHPWGTMKGTMKCPEGPFPCPKSQLIIYSPISHSCSLLSAQIYWCVCVCLSEFLFLTGFMWKTLSCLQCCSSHGAWWVSVSHMRVTWRIHESMLLCYLWLVWSLSSWTEFCIILIKRMQHEDVLTSFCSTYPSPPQAVESVQHLCKVQGLDSKMELYRQHMGQLLDWLSASVNAWSSFSPQRLQLHIVVTQSGEKWSPNVHDIAKL